MDECKAGFRIGGTLHSWGTLFDAVIREDVGAGYATFELPCAEAHGFATVFVELTAMRPDRPVTGLAYELADSGASPRNIFAELVIRLGPPDEIDRSEIPDGATASDSVTLYASWQRHGFSIGLSLYGAPRPSDFGDGIGKLYLNWTDTAAAAAPFLAAWQAAGDALVTASDGVAPAIFSLQYPIYDAEQEIPEPAERALSTPELLQTPPAIAGRLSSTTFALWIGPSGEAYLSNARDTVVLGTSAVQLQDIAPARGGGFTALEAGPWSVRDAHGSRAIAEAAAEIARLPGIHIERHSGYDV